MCLCIYTHTHTHTTYLLKIFLRGIFFIMRKEMSGASDKFPLKWSIASITYIHANHFKIDY